MLTCPVACASAVQRGRPGRRRLGPLLRSLVWPLLLALAAPLLTACATAPAAITPGPLLFTNSPDLVWGLIAALFIGNFMLLALNVPMVGLFSRVLRIPSYYLMPAVAMISFVGI